MIGILATYPFSLQKIKETLDHPIIIAVAASAHRVNQIVMLEERGPVYTVTGEP